MKEYLFTIFYKDKSVPEVRRGNKMTWVDGFFFVKTKMETDWRATFMVAMDCVKKIVIDDAKDIDQ